MCCTNRFNIQQLYALLTLYLCVLYLSEDKHEMTDFCNRDEKCLLRGTDWVFKQISLRFVFKGQRSLEYWCFI